MARVKHTKPNPTANASGKNTHRAKHTRDNIKSSAT